MIPEVSNYLGDGVYAGYDEHTDQICLKTERVDILGNRSWHVIYMDAAVLETFDLYRKHLKEHGNRNVRNVEMTPEEAAKFDAVIEIDVKDFNFFPKE